MEDEVSGVTRLGIALIALALAVGIGFLAFKVTRNTTADGAQKVERDIEVSYAAEYDLLDNTEVNGTSVLEVLYGADYRDKVVLVSTFKFMNYCSEHDYDRINDMEGVREAYLDYDNSVPNLIAYKNLSTLRDADTVNNLSSESVLMKDLAIKWSDSYHKPISNSDDDPVLRFINYNQLIGGNSYSETGILSDEMIVKGERKYIGSIYQEGTEFYCLCSKIEDEEGNVINNKAFMNVGRPSAVEYIDPGATFKAYLIKDSLDSVIGVAFIQM